MKLPVMQIWEYYRFTFTTVPMTLRAPARATKKKLVKKVLKTTKATKTLKTPKVKLKIYGKVVHYYDKIGVAIVKLVSPVRVGDSVLLKHGDMEFTQAVTSLQIELKPVNTAKKGDVVGMKVDQPAKEGSLMVAA